jgi:hypothetical protein
VDRGRLKARLKAQLTIGWELSGDLDVADEKPDVAARKALRDWADGLRDLLLNEVGGDHADYFIQAQTVEYRSELLGSSLLADLAKAQLGGEHKMRLAQFTKERLARLNKIVGEL